MSFIYSKEYETYWHGKIIYIYSSQDEHFANFIKHLSGWELDLPFGGITLSQDKLGQLYTKLQELNKT